MPQCRRCVPYSIAKPCLGVLGTQGGLHHTCSHHHTSALTPRRPLPPSQKEANPNIRLGRLSLQSTNARRSRVPRAFRSCSPDNHLAVVDDAMASAPLFPSIWFRRRPWAGEQSPLGKTFCQITSLQWRSTERATRSKSTKRPSQHACPVAKKESLPLHPFVQSHAIFNPLHGQSGP